MEAQRHPPNPPLPVEDLDHVLAHTPGLWEELRGQSLFITGGTGFFGAWLLESFAHANEQFGLQARAVVLTRNPGAFAARSPHLAQRTDIEFVAGDVRDFRLSGGKFSHVIHAGTTSSAPVEPQEMFETIVAGTTRVLEFAATHATRKLLFVSSGAVYGRQPSDLTHVPEVYSGAPDPLDPASAYGEGKRAAELLCILAGQKHGFETKIARCFAFVGPHLPLNGRFAVGNFIRDVLAGMPLSVSGDGTPHRSYLYTSDLAAWLWTILFRGSSGRAYNVGSCHDMTIAEVARTVHAALNSSTPVRISHAQQRGQSCSRYVPDTRRVEAELGLKETVNLFEGIQRTARWHAKSGSKNN